MAKKLILTLIASLILQGFTKSVPVNTKSSAFLTFDEWLATFDPSTAVASKLASCTGKTNGFYPILEPETTCADIFIACVFDVAYEQFCSPGLPTQYFDSRKGSCQPVAGAKACEEDIITNDPEIPRITVPVYGCDSNKINGYAYAITECSASFYTCEKSTPVAQSCSAYGTENVFDYKSTPGKPSSALCVPKSIVSECHRTSSTVTTPKTETPNTITPVTTTQSTTPPSTTTPSTTTPSTTTPPNTTPPSTTTPSTTTPITITSSTTTQSTSTPITTTPSTTTPTSTTPNATPPAGFCSTKPNGSYADEPDYCSASYRDCLGGYEFPQTCVSNEVFDNAPTVKKCVSHYEAISDPCEATYPPPICTASNVGLNMPVGRCSEIYYICLSSTGSPSFKTCAIGEYFSPVTRICSSKTGVVACQ